jgi:hypothetical protein
MLVVIPVETGIKYCHSFRIRYLTNHRISGIRREMTSQRTQPIVLISNMLTTELNHQKAHGIHQH